MARKRSRKKKSKSTPSEPVFSQVEDAFFSSVSDDATEGARDEVGKRGKGAPSPEKAAAPGGAVVSGTEEGETAVPVEEAVGEAGVAPDGPPESEGPSETAAVSTGEMVSTGEPEPGTVAAAADEAESPAEAREPEPEPVPGEVPVDLETPSDTVSRGAIEAESAVSGEPGESEPAESVVEAPEVGESELGESEPEEIEIYESDLFDGGDEDSLDQMTDEGLDVDAYGGALSASFEEMDAEVPSSLPDEEDSEPGQEGGPTEQETEGGVEPVAEEPARTLSQGEGRGQSVGEEIVVLTEVIDTVVPEEDEENEVPPVVEDGASESGWEVSEGPLHRGVDDETTLPEEAFVALGEDTGDIGVEDAVDAADPSLLESGDPGDLPEPPAGSEVLKLPVAEVPSELGWDVIPDDLVEPATPDDVEETVERDQADEADAAEEAVRHPLWSVPEFVPAEASEFDEALEQVPSTIAVDMSPLEATAKRFLDLPSPLPFVETHTVTIEEQFEEAVTLLRNEAELAASPELKAAYHLAAARLLLGEGRLGDARQAIEDSLAAKDTFAPTLRLLEEVERDAEHWDALLDVYETVALAEETDEGRAAALVDCAELCLTKLDAPDKAVTYLNDALDAVSEDLTALRRLEEAYRRLEDWQAVIGVRERIAAKLPPGGQVLAFHELGEIAQSQLGDSERATEAFARALDIDLDHAPSRMALEALWRQKGNLGAVREQYERDARRLEGFAAVQAWLQVADLSEALDQHDEAIDALRQAMELDPVNPALRREYQGRLARAGRWKLYVQTALNELEHSDNDEASAAIYLFIAQLYELALDDLETARGAVTSALELQPGWRFAREEQLRLMARSGHWQELADKLAAMAASEEDSRTAAGRYYQAAAIAEQHLEDPDAAIEWLESALAADPDEKIYAWSLRQALEQAGLWERVYAQEDIQPGSWPFAAEPDPRAGEWEQRGLIAELRTGDSETALECYRKAFALGARSPIALGGQFRILRRNADWEGLLDLLERVQDEATSPAWKAAIAWDRARILADSSERSEEAAALRDAVIEEVGFLPAVWEKLAALKQAGDLDAYLEVRQRVGGDVASDSPLEMLMEAMYWARRGNSRLLDEATADTDSRWAFDVRELWLCESGDLDGLVETYAERLESTPDNTLARYLRLRMATWLEARERWEDAWSAVADVVRVGTIDPVTLNRLERVGVARGRMADLDAVLSSVADVEGAGGDIMLRLARLREHHLGDQEKALEAYQLAWRAEPESYQAVDGVARLADALDLPELAGPAYAARAATLPQPADQAADWLLAGDRFARVEDDEKTEEAYGKVLDWPVLRRRAFERLVQLYRTRADVDGLEIIYDRWIGEERDGVVRQCLIMELADQLEALGALRPAIAHFERLAVSEQYLPACLRLERIHLVSEDWSRYVAALQARMEAVQSDEAASTAREAALIVQAARLHEPWAMEQVLQRRIEEGDTSAATMEAYRMLLAFQERWTDLTVFLEEQAARSEHQDDKVRYLLDSGWIYANKLEELDLATDRYQDILDLVEGEPEALAALVDISRRRQDWNGMVAALARKAVTLDDDAKVTAYREIAKVWDEKIDDPETAVQAYQKVLQLSPDDPVSLGALTNLYRKLRKWPEFVDTADRWLTVRKDEDPTLLNEVGITLARRLDEPERAVPFLLRALARGQGDLEVLRGVAERFESDEKWIEAAELYERVADGVDDPDAAIDLYERTATLCRERLQDVDRAIAVYEKLLKKVPDHLPALWSLARVYQDAGRRDDALELLGELIRHPSASGYLEKLTDVERLEFHRQFGTLLSDAGFREEAAAHYQEALRFMPSDQGLLDKLAQLYRGMERWDKYADILQARIDTSPDLSRETLAQRYEELGRAYHAAGKPDRALEAYKQARDLVPNQVQTYLSMAEIYQEREDWKTLLGLYNSVIKYSPEPEQVVEAYIRKADILYHRLAPMDPAYVSKAVLHYEKAVLYDRRNAYAMLRLAEIALESRQFQKAQDWLRRVLVLEPEGDVLARTLVLGGVLCAEVLKDPEAARANFEKAAAAWSPLEEHLSSLTDELEGTPGKLERFLGLYRQLLPWNPVSEPDGEG